MKAVIGTLIVLVAFGVFVTVVVAWAVRLTTWVESWALATESEYDRWKAGDYKAKRRVIASDKARRRSTLTDSR